MNDEQLLDKYGWDIVCESPFEIESWDDDGNCLGTATGDGADIILKYCEKIEKKKKKNK